MTELRIYSCRVLEETLDSRPCAEPSLHFVSHHDVLHGALCCGPAHAAAVSTKWLLVCPPAATSSDSVLWLNAKAHQISHHKQCLYRAPFGCYFLVLKLSIFLYCPAAGLATLSIVCATV